MNAHMTPGWFATAWKLVPVVLVAGLVGRHEPTATAAVVVISNRTPEPVEFRVAKGASEPGAQRLESGDVMPIPATGPVAIAFTSGSLKREFELASNSVYFFAGENGKLELQGIGLSPGPAVDPRLARKLPTDQPAAEIARLAVVPVKVFVDEDEKLIEKLWIERATQRIEEASEVFETHCRVRFRVTEVGTWASNDQITDFNLSLSEFEKKTDPGAARLAIGFTSQYERELRPTRKPLGGTRGPFRRHILIREWPRRVSEAERLEVLVHELGHFLGATHSPERSSSMRPVVGDRQANAAEFRIGFDPINTLILFLIGEEMRTTGLSSFNRLSMPTKLLLRDVYTTMGATVPKDPSSSIYLRALRLPPSNLATGGPRRGR